MNTHVSRLTTGLVAALLVASLTVPAGAVEQRFTLARAVPNDVFLYIAGQHNPEREFLCRYWDEVMDALAQCGIGSDLMELIGSVLGEEELAEVERLKARASQLLAGVDWKQLAGKEMVFAERMPAPIQMPGGGVTMGPPDMVWLFRGSGTGAAKNYEGLVAILEGIVEEVNKAMGAEALVVDKTPRMGAKVAGVNVLSMVPGAPPLPVTVALHGDVVAITVGQQILVEVLGLLGGEGTAKALADDARFQSAFAKLPPAEDTMLFFDMQAMLRPLRNLMDIAVAAQGGAGDVVLNSTKTGEAHVLCMKAWQLYQQQDYKQGLQLVEQAYEKAPSDSRVLYYLACFHALNGNQEKAVGFLQQAVEGGFYCPQHIAKDPDLEKLRGDERYDAALAQATKLAEEHTRKVGNPAKRVADRLMDVPGILDYVAAVEYTDGYSVRSESFAVLIPGAKDNPFYPVFGRQKPLAGFDRYLPRETMSYSLCGGFDLGELYKFIEDSFRVAGPKGEGLLAQWEQIQQQFGIDVKQDVIAWIDGGFVSVTLEDAKGSVWMIKVTDEETARSKVGAAIEFFSTKLSEGAAQNPMLNMLAVRKSPAVHEKLEGFENLFFGMLPQPVVWGVADGHLIFGSSADAVALCLATAKGEHPNIRQNARVIGEALVPEGPFASVALTDRRALGKELAQVIGVISMASGMATMAIPDPEIRPVISKLAGMLGKLTPVVSKIDFYKSAATHCTFDGRAWHTRMVTHYVTPEERAGSEAQ